MGALSALSFITTKAKSMFKTEATNEETQGVWTEYTEDCELLIARAANDNFLKEVDRLEKPHIKKIRKGTLSSVLAIEIQAKAMAKTILLGWRGKGVEGLEYNQVNATKALKHDDDLREFVVDFAADSENFRTELIEEQAGKSPTTSSGSENSEK